MNRQKNLQFNRLFENSEVKSQLIEDIENAKKEIVIFTTALLLSKIKEYFSLLSNKYSNGIKIYFVLSNKLKNKQSELLSLYRIK